MLGCLPATAVRAAGEWQRLNGHVPEAVAQLQAVGQMDGSQRLRLAIGVAPRDEQGLDTFIQELYDPGSTHYRHYLKPEEFTEKFGPTEQAYEDVINFAEASGLKVTRQQANRVVLDVEGSVADIEKALQVTLRTYRHPTEERLFYAPDSEPSIPSGLRILHIGGLNDYTLPHSKHERRAKSATAKEGSAPGGQLWGNDFRDAYAAGTTLTGAGQDIGLLEFQGYYAKDITAYENAIGLSANNRPELVVVPLNGGATPKDGGDNGEECSIDIELSVAMAPGLSKIYVFENGESENNSSFDDILESMVTYTKILQFSCSWGGSTERDPASEVLFKQMAAQGQSFFDASGDDGAFVGPVEFPADSPSITQVGGTTLTDGGAPSYPWEGEVAWDWDSGPEVSALDATSSSGGISTYYAIPYWQTNISMAANLGSTTMRNTPDVAANADNCYIFFSDGQQSGGFGGTSCAAPLWAALTALVNEQAAAGKDRPVGFLNPALYALAAGADYIEYFHDITSGNDTWKNSPDQFYAVAGYDLCCGLGSMNGTSLIDALAASTGPQGGSLKATIEPPAAITAGAKWQVDGGPWQKSGASVTNLLAGDHTVSFNMVRGWAAPAAQTVAVGAGSKGTTIGTYAAVGSLKVIINPALVLNAGAQWQINGGTWQDNGATVPDLAVGDYMVSFSQVSGWISPGEVNVSIKAESVTTITETCTLSATGIYNGLFARAPISEQTAGMMSGLAVTKSGAYSGRLWVAGHSYAFTGAFNAVGQASNTVKRASAQGGPLGLQMTLNWNDSPPNITGTVSGANEGGWTAGLTNELAAGNATSAQYTALILPGTPPGDGYILITNHAGSVTLRGTLADGTSFTQSVPLSGGGDWPVYANLYGGSGLLLGWIGLEGGSPSGNLAWIKQASHSPLYASGFTNVVLVQGSPWINPSVGTAALDLSLGQLEISGGSLAGTLSFGVTVSNNNAVVKLPGSFTNSLTGSINPKTGLLTVTFGNGAGKATTSGTGAVLQSANQAGGFFLGKTNAGSIFLQP